mmetsp:Transcript_77016/g.214162  ORF Transcript_77016/g.214162 Transcript_77016/m.214162 type:complete len:203 (+) Transcript_77016:455-1063(+)
MVHVPPVPEHPLPERLDEQGRTAQEHHYAHEEAQALLTPEVNATALFQQALLWPRGRVFGLAPLVEETNRKKHRGQPMGESLDSQAIQRHSVVEVRVREGHEKHEAADDDVEGRCQSEHQAVPPLLVRHALLLDLAAAFPTLLPLQVEWRWRWHARRCSNDVRELKASVDRARRWRYLLILCRRHRHLCPRHRRCGPKLELL